jgi:hypothetical protein
MSNNGKVNPRKTMHGIKLNKILKPVITIRQLDAAGKEISRQVCGNSMTYAAGDMMVNALLNSGPFKISHLYARFGDETENPGFLAPPSDDIRASVRDTFLHVNDGDVVRGGLWVPLQAAPIKDLTDATKYSGNQATFFFRIPYNISTTQISPSSNFNVSTSYIYALGLAVASSSSDRTQDRIVSVLQAVGFDDEVPDAGDFAKFLIPSGGQSAIDYSLPFQFET